MLKYAIIGSALAFTAAIQPGPFQAYLLSRVAAIGWRRTLPAALAPLLSDGPIAVLALLVLGQLSPTLQSLLRLAGSGLLFYFAVRTFLQWVANRSESMTANDKTPRTLIEAALVNLLNPNPYIGWALILGPITIAAWEEAPSSGVIVVASFYATIVVMQAILICAFGSARLLGPKFQRVLLFLSAMILAGLGVYQLVIGLGHFID